MGRDSRDIGRLLRREKVHDLLEQGMRSPTRIGRILKADKSTISKDIKWIEAQFVEACKESGPRIKGRQLAQFAKLYQKWFPLATANKHEVATMGGPVKVKGPNAKAAAIVLKTMHEEAALMGFGLAEDKDKAPNAFKELAAKAAAAPPAPSVPEPSPEIKEAVEEAITHKGILN